jgi:hypothetical protein
MTGSGTIDAILVVALIVFTIWALCQIFKVGDQTKEDKEDIIARSKERGPVTASPAPYGDAVFAINMPSAPVNYDQGPKSATQAEMDAFYASIRVQQVAQQAHSARWNAYHAAGNKGPTPMEQGQGGYYDQILAAARAKDAAFMADVKVYQQAQDDLDSGMPAAHHRSLPSGNAVSGEVISGNDDKKPTLWEFMTKDY